MTKPTSAAEGGEDSERRARYSRLRRTLGMGVPEECEPPSKGKPSAEVTPRSGAGAVPPRADVR
jgi:hypothetical protein